MPTLPPLRLFLLRSHCPRIMPSHSSSQIPRAESLFLFVSLTVTPSVTRPHHCDWELGRASLVTYCTARARRPSSEILCISVGESIRACYCLYVMVLRAWVVILGCCPGRMLRAASLHAIAFFTVIRHALSPHHDFACLHFAPPAVSAQESLSLHLAFALLGRTPRVQSLFSFVFLTVTPSVTRHHHRDRKLGWAATCDLVYCKDPTSLQRNRLGDVHNLH